MKSHHSKRKVIKENPKEIHWRLSALLILPLALFAIGFLVYVTTINSPKKTHGLRPRDAPRLRLNSCRSGA